MSFVFALTIYYVALGLVASGLALLLVIAVSRILGRSIGPLIAAGLLTILGAVPPSALAVLYYARSADAACAYRGPGIFAQLGGGPFNLALLTISSGWTLGSWTGATALAYLAVVRIAEPEPALEGETMREAEDGAGQDLYLGVWELLPELSIYQQGPMPASGRYTIERDGDALRLRVDWTMEPGGEPQSTVFGGPADGSPQPIPGAEGPGPDAFSLTRVDERTLDSAALRGETTLAYARRVASADGHLLSVMQEGPTADGGRFRNFQVYRRRSDDAVEGA